MLELDPIDYLEVKRDNKPFQQNIKTAITSKIKTLGIYLLYIPYHSLTNRTISPVVVRTKYIPTLSADMSTLPEVSS